MASIFCSTCDSLCLGECAFALWAWHQTNGGCIQTKTRTEIVCACVSVLYIFFKHLIKILWKFHYKHYINNGGRTIIGWSGIHMRDFFPRRDQGANWSCDTLDMQFWTINALKSFEHLAIVPITLISEHHKIWSSTRKFFLLYPPP